MISDGIQAVQDEVLGSLRQAEHPRTARDVIRELTAEGHSEDLVLAAIWRLLSWKRARLTRDLDLALPAEPSEAPAETADAIPGL